MLNKAQKMYTRATQALRPTSSNNLKIMKNMIARSMVVLVAGAVTLTGCSQVIKTGANVGLAFAENHMIEPILSVSDTNMVCSSGTSLLPLIISTAAMGADATNMSVLLYVGSAACAEDEALESELAYIRASRAGRVEEAQDQRIAQKRWAAVAATRQYAAYQQFQEKYERVYRIKLGEQCPSMKTDLDKMVYMLGLVAGIQAVTNDISAQGAANVPKDIAAVTERGMKCLDNEQFWGVPLAVRAAVWVLLPGAGEGKPDPWQTLKDSTRLGERKGVRLAHAIYGLAAQATGKDDVIREALKTYGRSVEQNMPVNPKFVLFDAMGGHQVLGIADRYWTQNTGKRSPEDGLTKFWDESDIDAKAVDDLLN
jgi:hypothetical protein